MADWKLDGHHMDMDIKPQIFPNRMEIVDYEEMYRHNVPNSHVARPDEMKYEIKCEQYMPMAPQNLNNSVGRQTDASSFPSGIERDIFYNNFGVHPIKMENGNSSDIGNVDRLSVLENNIKIENGFNSRDEMKVCVPYEAKYTEEIRFKDSAVAQPGTSSSAGIEKQTSYCCPKCNACFSLEQSFELHFDMKHGKSRPHKCKDCGRKFKTLSKMTLHQKTHIGQIGDTCEKCGKIFYSPKAFRDHVTRHDEKKKILSCPICAKEYSMKSDLIKHLNEHEEQKNFKCKECEESFYYKYDLIQHLRSHATERPYGCDQCGKFFCETKALRNHILREHSTIPCKQCKEVFSRNRDLTAHVKLVHVPVIPYVCDQCKKSYKDMLALKIHQRCHTGDLPYMCDHCHKCFATRRYLYQHLGYRRNGESLICTHCQMEFCSKPQLDLHVKIHKGEVPIKCEHCDRYFKGNGALNFHFKIKAFEHPLVCPHCSCSFIWKCALDEHLQIHARENNSRKTETLSV